MDSGACSNNERAKRPKTAELVENQRDTNRKFMQTIGEDMFKQLEILAEEKGVGVQTLLRAVIIPEWVRHHEVARSTAARTQAGSNRI